MSDWPYDDVAEPRDPGVPTWECPGGNCVCHDGGDAHLLEHAILLCGPDGSRMPGARVRVVGPSGELNHPAHADEVGWVVFELPRALPQVMVEWAPAPLPTDPLSPFRARYHLVLGAGVAGVRRRLSNLGFVGGSSLADDVRSFERHYGLKETGEPQAIEATLASYHDAGALPVVPVSPVSPIEAATRATPSPPAPPPPTLGHPKHGNGSPTGQGVARCDQLLRQIRVLDPEYNPVANTRCVVQVGGLRRAGQTNAQGVALMPTPRSATECALEWDAHGVALERLGVRLHGPVALDTFARLSNLGFRQQDLEARVESYQREMGRAVTGEEGHVAGEVAGWHDGGTKPHAGSEGPAATPGGTEIRHAAFAPGVLGAPVSLGLPLNLPLNVPLQTTASPPLRCIVFRDASGTLAPHARVFDKPNDIWRIDIFRGMHTGVTFFNSGGVDIRSNNPDNAVPNDAALFVDQGKSNSARHVFFFGRVPKSTSDFSKNQTALLLTPKNRTMLQVRVKPFTKNHQVLVRLFGKTMALNSRGLPAYVMDENENNISDGASAADHVEPATLIARVAKNAPVRHLVINAHAGMDVTIRGHIRLGHDLAHFGTKKKGDNIGFHRGNLDLWDALSGKVEFIWVQACFCGADNEFMGTIAHKTKAWVTGAAMLTNFKPKNVAKSHVELLHAFFMKHWSPSVSTLTFTPAKQDDFLQQGRRTSDPNLDAAMNFNVVKVR